MKSFVKAAAIVVISSVVAVGAHAQATRTWVSGVGDDVNPCSRTAPCKTWAGAISKTADNGEIDALDSGGFGTITITKNIVIDGGGTMASILAAGTTGVNVNDLSYAGGVNTIHVVLRNLSINGAATGVHGVNVVNGKQVLIENCFIYNFGTSGINWTAAPSAGQLHVHNTEIKRAGNGVNSSSINLAPTSGTLRASFDHVRVNGGTGNGLSVGANTRAVVQNSQLTENGNAGAIASAATSFVEISNSALSNNAFGIYAGVSGAPTFRLQNSQVTGNTSNGIFINVGGSQVVCYQHNIIEDNAVGNNCTSSIVGQ
jgi:hypothetical protein